MSNKTDKDKYISWEYFKVVDYCKEKGEDHRSNPKCLAEWNGIISIRLNHGWVCLL
jgi:hypothetical protein